MKFRTQLQLEPPLTHKLEPSEASVPNPEHAIQINTSFTNPHNMVLALILP